MRFLLIGLMLILASGASAVDQSEPVREIAMVIHGGAGTITRAEMTPELEREYRAKLEEALVAGHAVLTRGGSSLDAVEAAIRIMEDSPLFNAARGAVFTHAGTNELDASIMDGATLNAGAVGAVTIVRNPITAARAVMERSPHVMLIGRGAELFATEQGLEIVDPSYFWTERRWKQLQQKLMKGATAERAEPREYFGTVGAVALDLQGNLAAGTSTGGMTDKRFGRVGDSPIIGAGTWARNATCGVSGTGHGEYFIRYGVAQEISALMEHAGLSVRDAADRVVMKTLKDAGGTGGVIAMDAHGNIAMPFNTEGMYRGYIRAGGEAHTFIYGDEER
jgi:beta-aspartyl-peptidase (threonine type)